VRLITRNDTSLVVGLLAGTIVVFQRPFRVVWDLAQSVQDRYHVDLVPALTIFAGVLLFHEYRKRQQTKAESLVAGIEAAQSRKRSEELERLMTLSQALANARDQTALHQVLWRYLPAFLGEREFWLLTRQADRWDTLLRGTTAGRQTPVAELESMADRTLSPETLPTARLQGLVEGEAVCFPMLAGGEVVGVFGIHEGATLAVDERKAVGAAAAFMAIAVRNVQLFLETREHSQRDGLTNCFNRAHGLEMLDRELHRASRMRQPLSILMFDIDSFKTINDELGHLRGDDLLRAVGAQLTRVLRSTDVRCRYGGDEFLIILPDTPLIGAQQVAEGLRREIATLAMLAGDKTIAVTASFGVTAADQADLGVTALIERADEALYQAKRAGKNQSCVAGSAPSSPAPASSPVPATPAITVLRG
jgi:diguanylate cyclase (GGDEF)-like protein